MEKKKNFKERITKGSAFILAIVLTSLLAIIGTMFLLVARLNKMSTSSLAENKSLDFAVESVVAEISQQLALDTPGVRSNEEYYDYPDANNKWLANLEPYKAGTNYYWRHISDVDGTLGNNANDLQAEIKDDYQDSSKIGDSNSADADGDGVADSKWIKLKNVSSSKGKSIYAAIRVIDNGGMLNVNTARQFYYTANGSTQTDVNLVSLAIRGSTSNPLGKLDDARFGSEPHNLNNYIRDVVWQYDRPNGNYTPFDIGDELELRYRFLLNRDNGKVDTRIEAVWFNAFNNTYEIETPTKNLDGWFNRVQYNVLDPNWSKYYSYRHIGTTYNMDRVIEPNGTKMANVNDDGINRDVLRNRIKEGLLEANPGLLNSDKIAAQIAANIIDFQDDDSAVTVVNDESGTPYYGFERPCIYLSEFACRIKEDALIPGVFYRSYAVELCNPYEEAVSNDCNLVIDGTSYGINWSPNTKKFHVIKWEDPVVPLTVDPAANPCDVINNSGVSALEIFKANSKISLVRSVGGTDITVDSNGIPGDLVTMIDGTERSIQRDITRHKCIRRLWDGFYRGEATLGKDNDYYREDDDLNIQAHPTNGDFNNIGEIGMVLRRDAYEVYPPRIGVGDTEATVRIDVNKPDYQRLFNYLTVFDPNVPRYGGHPEAETRVKGRININTAPWYVLAQLPWVSQRIGQADDPNLARSIVAYRDKTKVSGGPDYSSRQGDPGFRSIGELIDVNDLNLNDPNFSIDYYARDYNDIDGTAIDQTGFPDLTANDGAANDYEERDLIFARISNLVTVRSDVFTAYILVRVGTDGPQKRMIAILDRSGVTRGGGKVKIVALHQVSDPR